jgi:hypothetical protein
MKNMGGAMARVMACARTHLPRAVALALVVAAMLVQAAPTTSGGDGQAFVNSIGIGFVRIPAGNFLMGSTDDDREASSAEKPQHRVTLTRPYLLARIPGACTTCMAMSGNGCRMATVNAIAIDLIGQSRDKARNLVNACRAATRHRTKGLDAGT